MSAAKIEEKYKPNSIQRKRAKQNSREITTLNKLAKEEGLSYGKYVAQELAKQVVVRKPSDFGKVV